MRTPGPWIAFLTTLFLLVGLCGLFTSYAASIPLERALARNAMLDGLATDPDPAARLQSLQPVLGSLAEPLATPEALPVRIAHARALVSEEQRRESASLTYRVRLMLAVVTLIAAVLGAGILALAHKSRTPSSD